VTFYVVEDNQTTVSNVTTAINQDEFDVKVATNLEQAFALISSVGDDDIFSLDSQVPNPGDGERIAEALRKAGKGCLIVWHSSIAPPDPERLGIYACQWPQRQWFEKVQMCAKTWKDKGDIYRYEDKAKYQDLCSKLLTPFVLLHLGLQTVAQDKNGKSNKLSPEEIESCRKGIALLKNKKFEIEKALCDLMGVPHPGKGDCPEPLTQLQKWVNNNNSVLAPLFKRAVRIEKFELLTEEGLNGVLAVIEEFSKIVNRAVDYGERVKKQNSDLRHFLDNAVPRLSGYPETLDEEGCRSVERDLKGLDSTLASVLAPASDEFWTDEIKEAAKSALSMIGKIRKALQQAQSGQDSFFRKNALLDALDQVARLTLPRMPRPKAK
jgi:hypothetical protein